MRTKHFIMQKIMPTNGKSRVTEIIYIYKVIYTGVCHLV
jgi:hypothetical protein